jgi:large subunit ribosomal protein L29
MKREYLTSLSIQELKDKVQEMKQQHARMVLNHTVSSTESPIGIRYSRRAIARVFTEIRNRELQQSAQ